MHLLTQITTQCTIDSDMETPLLKEVPLLNKFKTHLLQSIQTSIQCITGSDMETLSLREVPLLKPSHWLQLTFLIQPEEENHLELMPKLNKFKTHLPQSIQTSTQCTTDSDTETPSSKDPQLPNKSKTHQHQLIQTSTQCTTGSDTETPSLKDPPSPNRFKTHPLQSIQTSTQCTTGSDTETPSSKDPQLPRLSHWLQSILSIQPEEDHH